MRNGRPRLDPEDETVALTVRVPSRAYDALYAQASRERTTVPEFVRRALKIECRPTADRDHDDP